MPDDGEQKWEAITDSEAVLLRFAAPTREVRLLRADVETLLLALNAEALAVYDDAKPDAVVRSAASHGGP